MKNSYILGYTQDGEIYCRNCVAESLQDEGFRDPHIADEHDDFHPIFLGQYSSEDEFMCEYCFEELN